MNASPEDQAQLLVLADTDQQIRRLEHKRANLPEQQTLDLHVETHKNVGVDLVDATTKQDRLAKEARKHEQRIETANEARKHSESQIYSGQITSERELQALREQIARAHDTKNDIEDSLLEIMQQSEDIAAVVEELTARKQELADQIVDLTDKRDEASRELDAELAELHDRRQAEADLLRPKLVEAYESLRTKRQGRRVVARLENRMCTGCQLDLTAIELEEIKDTAKTSLAYCQQCGSIIVPA
ncbi:zinc ribbon domain-containing protein [Euzebya tangerina]|uniref:zinc ribbon domain-containing protein n=1 Tax=Euzebya tangerina TaxID=591198 RepID=UPI000E312C31|nr:hypothetical protein [Euzebya tangerina]